MKPIKSDNFNRSLLCRQYKHIDQQTKLRLANNRKIELREQWSVEGKDKYVISFRKSRHCAMTGSLNRKEQKNTVTALISHFFQILKMLLCTMYPETDLSIVHSNNPLSTIRLICTYFVRITAWEYCSLSEDLRSVHFWQNKFQKSTTYSKMHVDKRVQIWLFELC